MSYQDTARDIERAIKEIAAECENDQKIVAYEVLKEVVAATPVRTGRARGNWNVCIDMPDRTCNPYYHDKDGNETINRGLNVIRNAKLGQKIYISNTVFNPGDDPEDEKEYESSPPNLPLSSPYYIKWIDQGGSQKAPAGVTAPVMQAIQMKLNSQNRLSKGGSVTSHNSGWKEV